MLVTSKDLCEKCRKKVREKHNAYMKAYLGKNLMTKKKVAELNKQNHEV